MLPTTLPTGGVVKVGQATIGTNGSTLTVDQTSKRAVVDWNSFNIGSKAKVNFQQPGADAVMLNRVIGNEGSVIEGALHANGQVFLLNPNGVLFGKGAVVDTGGLLASTLDLSNGDFMAGKSVLVANGRSGNVVNRGSLTATGGGYIALIGNHVSNDGVITARLGTVALAAGDKVTLNFSGTSLVDVAVDRATFDALVENHQIIVADGGLVKLTAHTADSLLNTVVNNTGVIQSQTIDQRGGHIYLLGEGGKVEVAGTLDASAPAAGSGGHIETSGPKVQVADGTRITTSAEHGSTGTWLVDPTDFTVAASGGDMTGAALSSALSTSNVQLQSSAGSTAGSGDVNVNDAVGWSAHTLTLTAARNVNIRSVMSATGAASLDLEPATANGSDAAVAGSAVNVGMNSAGAFTGKVDFSGSGALTIGGQAYTVVQSVGSGAGDTTPGTLQGMQANLNGHYALGSDIDAASTASWNSGTGFASIGNNSSNFRGTLAGLGHLVSGLSVNTPTTNYRGLFGSVSGTSGSPVVIDNLALSGATVGCYKYCAILTGNIVQYTQIRNTTVSGTLAAPRLQYAGLAAGSVSSTTSYPGPYDSNFLNVFVSGTITTTSATYTGGLVGQLSKGDVANTHADVAINIAPGAYSGGQYIGGLVGYTGRGNIANSSATGAISLDSSVLAGTTSTASYSRVGGLVGDFGGESISDSYATGSISSLCVHGGCNSSDLYFGGLGGRVDSVVTSSYATGSITVQKSGTRLIGGLLGRASGSLSDSYATGSVSAPASMSENIGGLVGQASNEILTNSRASGSVSVGDDALSVGGLIGYVNSGGNTFTNNQSTGSVSAGANATGVGGAIGYVDTATISNLHATGAVTVGATASNVGGLIGQAGGNVALDTVYATGDVGTGDGASHVGGLIGDVSGGGNTITTAYAAGAVSVGTSSVSIGGLVGYADSATISKTYATGAVTAGAYANSVGGLIGEAGAVSLDNGYASGLISFGAGSSNNGGLIGADDSGNVVSHSFWNTTSSGQTTSAFGVGMTDAAMRQQVNFSSATAANGNANPGWDFSTDWTVYNSQTQPLLRAFMTPLTISVAPTKTYDGTVTGGLAVYSSAADPGHLFGSLSLTGAGRNVGTYAVTPSGQYSDQLGYLISYVGGSTTVAAAPLTVTATGGTQVYNGGVNANVTLASNAVVGDAVSLADLAATMVDKNVGSGKVVSVSGISMSGADAGNYTLQNTVATTTTNVTPAALTVAATGGTQVYNATVNANVTLTGNQLSGDQLTLVDTSATMVDKNVGSGKTVSVNGISVSGADAGNYTLQNTTAATTTTVTPAALTVAATGGTQVYNGGINANVMLAGNQVSGDQLTLADTSATMADKNVGSGKTVSVNGISVSGADAGNYTLQNTTAATTTTVTPAALTVAATGGTQVYNATVNANVTLAGNQVSGDQLTLADTSATMADKNVGSGKTVSVNGISVSGADAGNYTLQNTTAATTTTVTPAALTVAATGGTQVYNATVNANVTLTSNQLSGDQLTLADTSATMADKNVGSGKTVSVSGISVSGADAGNYTLQNTTAATTTTVTPAALTVAATGGTQVYDASVDARVTLTGNSIAGDAVTVSSASATMTDKNVGVQKAVSVKGIAIAGADAGNYALQNTTASTVTDVSPAALTATVTAANQVLLQGTHVVVTLGSNAIAGDDVAVHERTSTVPDAAAGAAKLVTVDGLTLSGADAGNYLLTSSSATTSVDILAAAGTGGTVIAPSVLSVIGSADKTSATVALQTSALSNGAVLPIPLAQPLAQTTLNGTPPMQVYATPGDSSDGSVTLDQLRSMLQVGTGQQVVVPVAGSKFVSLLNGGVKLPSGVEQQFFVKSAGH